MLSVGGFLDNTMIAGQVAVRAWETAPIPTWSEVQQALDGAVSKIKLPAPWEVPSLLLDGYRKSILSEPGDVLYQLARLSIDPVRFGEGIPEVNGRGVIFAPGFLGPSASGDILLNIFREKGWRTKKADLGQVNYRCPDKSGEDLLVQTSRLADKCGDSVVMIGHSLGGAKTSFVSVVAPELVLCGFPLGAPLNGKVGVHWFLDWVWQMIAPVRQASGATDPGCVNATCRCRANLFAQSAKVEGMHKLIAIVGDDPVVNRHLSIKPGIRVEYVPGAGHCGLIVNPDVIRVIGKVLTEVLASEAAANTAASQV